MCVDDKTQQVNGIITLSDSPTIFWTRKSRRTMRGLRRAWGVSGVDVSHGSLCTLDCVRKYRNYKITQQYSTAHSRGPQPDEIAGTGRHTRRLRYHDESGRSCLCHEIRQSANRRLNVGGVVTMKCVCNGRSRKVWKWVGSSHGLRLAHLDGKR